MRKTSSPLALHRQSIRVLAAPQLGDVGGGDDQGVSNDLPGALSEKNCTQTIATSETCGKPKP